MPPQASAATPQGQASTQAAASFDATLSAYKQRRSELNSQLVNLTVRRDLLTQQLRNAEGTDAQQLNTQLAIVSQRNNQVLKSLGEIDDAVNKLLAGAPIVVTSAPGQGIALPGVATVPPPVPIGALARDADRIVLISGVAIVVLVAALWRSLRRPVTALGAGDVGRLERLQQSVDAIALEVERLGESQRYVSKVLSEGKAIGAGPAEAVGAAKRENVPAVHRST